MQKTEDKLVKATKDASKITTEVIHGMMTQVGIILQSCSAYRIFCIFMKPKCFYCLRIVNQNDHN